MKLRRSGPDIYYHISFNFTFVNRYSPQGQDALILDQIKKMVLNCLQLVEVNHLKKSSRYE